jgi:HupE / UreJ protein
MNQPAATGTRAWSIALLAFAVIAIVTFTFTFAPATAHAHASSDAYLQLEQEPSSGATTLRIDIALRDLERELAIDIDDNRAITWGEVRRAWPRLRDHVRSAVELASPEGACVLEPRGEPALAERGGTAHAVFDHTVRCPAGAAPSTITYRLFASTDAGHRGLLRIDAAALAVLEPTGRAVPLPGSDNARSTSVAASAAAPGGFLHFMREGIAHIAGGADHLLFIVTLIVVAVFTREDPRSMGRWVVRGSRREIIGDTVRIVTAFTLTHSITLGLAAAGVLAPPSRWIESLIAASVLVAAIDNLRPIARMPRWALAGTFGFAHGFGFAGPLQELGLRGRELVVPLLGFNLGVEAGQLVIVGLVLPLLLAWRHAPRYRSTFVPALSVAVGLLATVWLVQRGFDVDFGLPL